MKGMTPKQSIVLFLMGFALLLVLIVLCASVSARPLLESLQGIQTQVVEATLAAGG